MTVQAWLIFTPAQRADAVQFSETTDFKVDPRVIDNPLAGQLGDAEVAVGKFVAPARILNDPEYGPVWSSRLSTLPIRMLDSEVIFLPAVD
ncbi:hypothetical protein ASG43_03385 [Aureimonas sp. Leaf454]|uniref:hypothetical protein n=1 Tax=Aureimonas sp. Leaf454 TaxID=1736381 RepID=UPI0006F23A14|nr:hypothetical protein [Aureimonas sp. Leaf454]KQT54643.1 hypothetical protein ASG43_03385 [Aureimonas sp. Leaf454]